MEFVRTLLSWAVMSVVATLCLAGCGGTTGPDEKPPSVPTVQVANAGNGEVRLTWSKPPEGDLKGFMVYRSDQIDQSVWDLIANLGKDSLGYTDSGLEYNTIYYYQVSAFDNGGMISDRSAAVPAMPANTTAPATPDSVKVVAVNISAPRMQISWAPVAAPDLSGYVVYRGQLPDFSQATPNDTLAKDDPTFSLDRQIDIGRVYYYWIVAFDRGGLSSASSASADDVALSPSVLISPADGGTSGLQPTFAWQTVSLARGYMIVLKRQQLIEVWRTGVGEGENSVTYDGVALSKGETYSWFVTTTTDPDDLERSNSVSDEWTFVPIGSQ